MEGTAACVSWEPWGVGGMRLKSVGGPEISPELSAEGSGGSTAAATAETTAAVSPVVSREPLKDTQSMKRLQKNIVELTNIYVFHHRRYCRRNGRGDGRRIVSGFTRTFKKFTFNETTTEVNSGTYQYLRLQS